MAKTKQFAERNGEVDAAETFHPPAKCINLKLIEKVEKCIKPQGQRLRREGEGYFIVAG